MIAAAGTVGAVVTSLWLALRAKGADRTQYVDTFQQHVKRVRGADTFADRLRFRFIRAFVQTDDGETFRVKRSPKAREV